MSIKVEDKTGVEFDNCPHTIWGNPCNYCGLDEALKLLRENNPRNPDWQLRRKTLLKIWKGRK